MQTLMKIAYIFFPIICAKFSTCYKIVLDFLQDSNSYKLQENKTQIRCISIAFARPCTIWPVEREITLIKKSHKQRIILESNQVYCQSLSLIVDFLIN